MNGRTTPLPGPRAGATQVATTADPPLTIRPAWTADDLDAVYRLTHDAYVALGYIAPQPAGRLRHYADIDAAPENVVLVGDEGGTIVGTVSVTVDGPARLHVDHDFRAACDAVRAEGAPVAASWRIVTAPDHRASSALVLELIRAVIDVVRRFGVDTVLMSFAPHHERAYSRLLGMTTLARTEGTADLSTPAVLMRASTLECARRLPPHDNPVLTTLVAERRRLLEAVRRQAA